MKNPLIFYTKVYDGTNWTVTWCCQKHTQYDHISNASQTIAMVTLFDEFLDDQVGHGMVQA